MKVSQEEARRLLAEAKKASEATQRAHAQMMNASKARRAAVRACMDAGIPRQEIADAIGVNRATLYEIASRN